MARLVHDVGEPRDTIIEFDEHGRVIAIGGEPWPQGDSMALDPLTAGIDLAGSVINKIWPDKSAAEAAQLAAAVAIVQGQIDVNKVEAASTNWFVAGGRPFILWGCGFAMLYAALFEPIMRFVATVVFHYTGAFPALDTTLTTQILLGILGLSGLRSYDKKNGVAS